MPHICLFLDMSDVKMFRTDKSCEYNSLCLSCQLCYPGVARYWRLRACIDPCHRISRGNVPLMVFRTMVRALFCGIWEVADILSSIGRRGERMQIGIISDTHSRHQIVEEALDLLRGRRIGFVLHCGDI